MSAVEQAKAVVWAWLTGEGMGFAGQGPLAPDHLYRGMHPFEDILGADALDTALHSPMRAAFGPMQRRIDLFLASHDRLDPARPVWVLASGHLFGSFEAPFLGIPPTGRLIDLPFASYFRVDRGVIAESIEHLDLLALLDQAGRTDLVARQTAARISPPAPRTHDGIQRDPGDPAEAATTLALSTAMLADLSTDMRSPSDHLARWWHRDMNWHGPAGIGACMGYASYQRGHTGPFEARLAFLEVFDEMVVIAEGAYSAHLWRPCLKMRSLGGFLGLPPAEEPFLMRVTDLYRRDGEKLAENWIYIDMPHVLAQHGRDPFAGRSPENAE
ncbi:MAG: ester cyclase [Pseudomonadota bacterium]